MAFQPIINNNFAGVSFSPAWGNGDVPVTAPYTFDALPNPMTQQYITGTLLAEGSTPDKMVIYDSTVVSPAQKFKAVFFDELAPNPIPTGISANCAIQGRPTTLFLYSILIGANLGHVDIDALIAAGYANVVYQYRNNVQIKYVQFKGLGVGS